MIFETLLTLFAFIILSYLLSSPKGEGDVRKGCTAEANSTSPVLWRGRGIIDSTKRVGMSHEHVSLHESVVTLQLRFLVLCE